MEGSRGRDDSDTVTTVEKCSGNPFLSPCRKGLEQTIRYPTFSHHYEKGLEKNSKNAGP